ncbi:endolytic transglycosylase MltG [Marinobacter salinisoli]|uniref:Endolytic murein transglycosylase n=1 Tax=Marinobacter salinisoli TaxID=2769486 RepID=A0ABX7MMU7_9GAMM|nr:endolytic transglycosylase MltG [Marinobacter salinisoli]QSP93493.1 endolytic transglycosylase MltG [Marinobacter salinisoli]
MFKKLLIGLVSAVILAVTGTGLWLSQGLNTLEQPVVLDEPVLFNVPKGAAFVQVARKLESEGLIERGLWLRVHGRLNPDQAQIKAGEYEFTSGMTPREMLSAMVAGDTKQWAVQFIEGWTFADMRAALASHERLKKETTDWTDEQIMEAVGAEGEHPEGRFFPDTYLFTSSESDLDLLQRAFDTMSDVLAKEWAAREEGLPYDSAYEALIMASIVERETGVPYERDQVAGVFVRRLQKGMRLQTDPTVIYGMGDKYDGRIRSRDLREYTPYNTYRINGLPPTPIALPGRGAIHAALNPAEGEALYFVARGDGTHKFSKTLNEHQKAVREYQLNRRKDYRSSPPVQEADGGNGGAG